MTSFESLGLAAPLLKALAAEGYTHPTPIQAQTVPILTAGHDLIGLAQTGAGKTAAFALPILQRLSAVRLHAGATRCRALILAPTRELAAQIGESFRTYGRFLGLSTTVVFGGASMVKQKQAMARGVDILVATPGRLLDHVGQRSIRLDQVEVLVLDEADHMLDMGFIHALNSIAQLLPKPRQTVLFSATMPAPIAQLAQKYLTDPQRIEVTPVASTPERVDQRVIHVDGLQKQALLVELLKDETISRALVFSRTKHGADRIARKLEEEHIYAETIHGNKSQGQRERALEAFKKGRARLLIATEIAARGIDVEGVTHVLNYDLPNVPEQYVHRIGRTARAGAAGVAISFCQPDERAYLKDIEKLIAMPVPVMETRLSLPTPDPSERPPRPPKPGQRNRPGRAPRPHNPQPHRERPKREAAAEGEPRRHARRDDPWSNHAPEREPRRDQRNGPRSEHRSEFRGDDRQAQRSEQRSEHRGEYRGDQRRDGARGPATGPAKGPKPHRGSDNRGQDARSNQGPRSPRADARPKGPHPGGGNAQKRRQRDR
jgi:ATP-dependent RNA helicase RhlE